MNLQDGYFKTEVIRGRFCISITEESDISLDGGYEFENVKNSIELSHQDCKNLLAELQDHVAINP